MGYDAGLTNLIATQPLRIREANDQSNMTRAQTQGQNISNKVNQMITPYKVQAAQQEVSGNDLDQNKKKLELISNIAYSVVDQPSYEKALNYAKSMGLDTSQFGPQYDPNQINQVKMGLASATARLGYQAQLMQMTSRGAQQAGGYYLPQVGAVLPYGVPDATLPASNGMTAPAAPSAPATSQPTNGLLNPAAGMQGTDALPQAPVEQRPMSMAPNPGPQGVMQNSTMQQSADALPDATQAAPVQQKPTAEMANQAMSAIMNNPNFNVDTKKAMADNLKSQPWYAEIQKNAEAMGTKQADIDTSKDIKTNEAVGQETGDAVKTYNIMTSNLPTVIQRFAAMRNDAEKASYGMGVDEEGNGFKQKFFNNFKDSETAQANNSLMQRAAQGILPELGPQLQQAGVKGNKFLETIANNASGLRMDAPPDSKVKLIDGLENTYVKNLKATAAQLRSLGHEAPSDEEIDQMVEQYKSKQDNSTASVPEVGSEEDGHVFNGGDPSNPENWRAK